MTDLISTETIKIYGDIDINKNYTEKDLDFILKNLYSTEFFEDIKVQIDKNTLKINVKEYPIVNQLVIVGEKSTRYKEQIEKIIKLKEKRTFIKSYLSKDIESIKSLYASIGFNSAQVETKIKETDKGNFDLLILTN